MLNKVLKEQLGWDDPKKSLDGHVMHYKQFQATSLHIFVGMVGCYMKTLITFNLCIIMLVGK
jgi:hypothetical protein